MGGIIKHLSPELNNAGIVFFRNALAFVILVPLIAFTLGRAGFVTREWRFHALRGIIGVSAMACFFYVLGRMHFTEAILLKLTTPFFIPLVALLWLREPSSRTTLFAIAIGFIGVIFIVDPKHKGWSEVDLVMIGLLGAVLAAVAKVTIRRMRSTEPSLRIVFYFSLIASLCSFPFAWQHWQSPSLTQMAWLFTLAVVATVGQLLITAAYRRVSAGKIGQFTYTSLVFSSTMGWWLWDEALTLSIVLGCLFIVSAGLINLKSK
ncbi:MAG: DMT family transporter [Oleiphilaceae bacterium]|nr:DMT family transporter [Oleiphilaceae bacterium]